MTKKEHVMIELTEQQQRAIDAAPEVSLIDPRTQKAYVLVGADLFERMKGLLKDDDELNMRQVAILVERAMSEDDAGDPSLAFYQEKYGRKQ